MADEYLKGGQLEGSVALGCTRTDSSGKLCRWQALIVKSITHFWSQNCCYGICLFRRPLPVAFSVDGDKWV